MTNLAVPRLVIQSRRALVSETELPNEILSQRLFLKMLCLERKRSERSGRRLVLMLLESPSLVRGEQSPVFPEISRSLAQSIRDTDITGWYDEGKVLGVLFTEIGASGDSIVETLETKIRTGLQDELSAQQLTEVKLSFYVFPDDCSGHGSGRRAFSVLYPDLVEEIESKRASLFIKRCIDVIGSLALIILLSPVFLLLAIIVKLTSSGPVLFRQTRLGQFGEGFTFLKFRSMYAKSNHAIHEEYIKRLISNRDSANEDGASQKIYKIKDDPRITKVGGFLRRTSLDELPQLFNVLTGQMSLVGPRPPLMYEFESYEVWHRRRLMAVKPGITGFWQVEGRSRVKFDDMVRMDLEYAREWSLWLDLKILWRTPRAVISGSGAY